MLRNTKYLSRLGALAAAADGAVLGVLLLFFGEDGADFSFLRSVLLLAGICLFGGALFAIPGLFLDGSAKLEELRIQRRVIRQRQAKAEAGQLELTDHTQPTGALTESTAAREGQIAIASIEHMPFVGSDLRE